MSLSTIEGSSPVMREAINVPCKSTHDHSFPLQIIDNTCEDGLVFDESSIQFAKCSFPFSVDCNGRPELQQARPSGVCPRRNGYFPHENPEVSSIISKDEKLMYVHHRANEILESHLDPM